MESTKRSLVRVTHEGSALDLSESGGVVGFRDDFPYYGALTNRLREAHQKLIQYVYSRRSIVADGMLTSSRHFEFEA